MLVARLLGCYFVCDLCSLSMVFSLVLDFDVFSSLVSNKSFWD
jgi:hypothetical protein